MLVLFHILHQYQKASFLAVTQPNINAFTNRNRVSLPLLRMVQDVSFI